MNLPDAERGRRWEEAFGLERYRPAVFGLA